MAQNWLEFLPVPQQSTMSPEQASMQGYSAEEIAALNERAKKRGQIPTQIASGPAPLPFQPDPNLSREVVSTPLSEFFTKEDRARLEEADRTYRADRVALQNSMLPLQNLTQSVREMPTGLDFTPMAALADKWSGGGNQLTQAAQSIKGMSPEEKAGLLAKLQAQEAQQQQNLLGVDTHRLQGLESNKLSNRNLEIANKNTRFQMSQDLKKEDQLRNDVQKTIVAPILEDKKNFETMEAAFNSGNSQMIGIVLSNFARTIGNEKGVLTDEDIKRLVPKNYQGSMAQMLAYFNENPSATLTPEYTKNMTGLIQIVRERLQKKHSDLHRTKKNAYSAGSYAPLMRQGEVGDVIFNDAQREIDSLSAPAAKAVDPIKEILQKMPKGK